jgi:hypothetical protein
MNVSGRLWILAATGALVGARGPTAYGGDPPPPGSSSASSAPDESLLGTVEVNGAAGLAPLPKLAVVPIVTTGSADSIANLVVRRDMELSGQFDVMDESASPAGPFTHASPVDLGAWRGKGAEYVLRILAEPAPNDSIRTQLVGEAYVTPARAASDPASDPKPAFRTVVLTSTLEVRAASHRLVDQLLGALTGRPGGSSPSTRMDSTCDRSDRRTPSRFRRRSARTIRYFTPFRATTHRFASSSARTPLRSLFRFRGRFSASGSAPTTRASHSVSWTRDGASFGPVTEAT